MSKRSSKREETKTPSEVSESLALAYKEFQLKEIQRLLEVNVTTDSADVLSHVLDYLETKRRLGKQVYREMFNSSGIPQALFSLDGKLINFNEAFFLASGKIANDLWGLSLFSLMDPEDIKELMKVLIQPEVSNPIMHLPNTTLNLGYPSICYLSILRDAKTGSPLYFDFCILPHRPRT
jgi:hypothetical protein